MIERVVGQVGTHLSTTQGKKAVDVEGFKEALAKAGATVLQTEAKATAAVEVFAKGTEGRIHETVMALEKADISFRFAVQVRNKVIDAYREVMRMGA